MEKVKKTPKRGWSKETMAIYVQEALKRPWLLLTLIVGTVGLQGAMLTAPLYLRQFFNILATNTPTEETMNALFVTLYFIAGAYFLEWASRRIHVFSMNFIDSNVMASLYRRSFQYLIRHSYHFFTGQFAGTLTRRVSKFANAFEIIFDSIMMQFVPTILFIVGAVTILFLRNNTLGLMLGGWVILFVAVQFFFVHVRRPLRIARTEEDSRMVGNVADAIGNQNTITLFSGVDFETTRFTATVARWYKALIRTWNAEEVVWSVLGFLMAGIEVALLYGAVLYWQQGLLTIGDFALIQAYLLTTFDRLVTINRELRRFNEAFADAGEMVEILETPLEIADMPGAKKLAITDGHIAFKDVGFHFTDSRPLLQQFNLSVSGGEKIALVGPSGAGKSTVTKLLLRLYDVKSGEILIDEQNIREATQDSVRDAIAFVPQEPILFHRTLMENIRYGRRDATDEEVIEASKQAHCYEFVMQTSEKFETFVGERGIRLSGGERQRIAIARAILKDAPILVLDEATSSLDSESESLIQDALAKLMEGKTVIAIAHRLSTVMKMDRIIVIEDGAVVMSGTHDELLAHGGLYKKLWEIQAGGFLADDTEGK